jgi:acetyl esterase/lipase
MKVKSDTRRVSWQARALTQVLPHLVKTGFRTSREAAPDVANLRTRTARLSRLGAMVSAVMRPRVTRRHDLSLHGEWTCPGGEGTAANAAILYLHGGGFYFGSPATHRPVTTELAHQCRLPVFSLAYRLAPEHPFPCALDDVLAAYRSLVARGIAPYSIVFAGDSAGGNLAIAAMIALREAGEDLPAGAVLLSPWLDLDATSRSFDTGAALPVSRAAMVSAARMYVGAAGAQNPLISPACADLHALPPVQIQVSDAESMFDEARRFAIRFREAGGAAELAVWRGMPHAWPCFAPFLPEAGEALRHAAHFARQCVGMV